MVATGASVARDPHRRLAPRRCMTQADGPYQVAVIGAGPMGSFAAERLARAGLRTVLLEKDPVPGTSTVCGGGMHIEVPRYAGLPDAVIERHLKACRLVVNGTVRDWRFSTTQYVTIKRSDLDRYLAERAVKAGATLRTRALVKEVRPSERVVRYEETDTGLLREVAAEAFIFADGPNSLAFRTIPGLPQAKDVRWVGVEYDLTARPEDFDALEIVLDRRRLPFGYYWVFPKSDHVNVGLIRWATADGPALRGLLDEFIASRDDLRGRAVMRRVGGVIPATTVSRLQWENCLVIGDAAGMLNPLTGGGYICGFLSAALAAQACVEAFAGGRLATERLRRYGRMVRRTHHYWVVRGLSLLLEGMAFVERRLGWPLYPAAFDAYFRFMHFLLLKVARPLSSESSA
jgi:digeranylgeranylglycerophospholipid reductase